MNISELIKKKTVIVGMGNPLKGDDGAGVLIVEKLMKKINSDKIKFFIVEEAIENYLGKIKRLNPDTIIIFDAVDFGGEKGEIKFFKPTDIMNISTTTHSFSLPDLLKIYNLIPRSVIIGIQPVKISFGEEMCQEVKKGIEEIVTLFVEYIKKRENEQNKN